MTVFVDTFVARPSPEAPLRVNVADRLAAAARQLPAAVAVAAPARSRLGGPRGYRQCTFGELDLAADRIARGLLAAGVEPGDRLVLLVRPGIEFVALAFGLLRSGATAVLIDPGMPRRYLLECLQGVRPHGFVAISRAQALRTLCRRRFPDAAKNVTVGRRWFWGGATYASLMRRGAASAAALPETRADDPAAVIFTSGSTGPPKGVQYTQRMFGTQAAEIAGQYGLRAGGVDLACFPLFGLFNAAMGVTTVFPRMDFSRPAAADPRQLLAAARDWGVTQAFASPAVWDKLSRYCAASGDRIPTLREIFSCGAPVPAAVLRRMLPIAHPEARMHTPYGATECLPVSTIEAREVLEETAAATAEGAGVCVGRPFPTIDWKVIAITDQPIARWEDAVPLPSGAIGELAVCGPQVSPRYWGGPGTSGDVGPRSSDERANALAKIPEGDRIWHRVGDVGYLDDRGRFWYCGRKAHRVETAGGVRFSVPAEEIVNEHPAVRRSALAGIGAPPRQTPVMIVELQQPSDDPQAALAAIRAWSVRHPSLADIDDWRVHAGFPVDVRHNAKIDREALSRWAAGEAP